MNWFWKAHLTTECSDSVFRCHESVPGQVARPYMQFFFLCGCKDLGLAECMLVKRSSILEQVPMGLQPRLMHNRARCDRGPHRMDLARGRALDVGLG